ncbi:MULTISPECIES: hypothetical protein [unclassified Streptomyces]|nr:MULTISPECIES: hypothetical protein [unclassified Streptomyces]WUC62812.1 hypothetical protein OG861_00510 [Streptomyces sp. NBC_00539]
MDEDFVDGAGETRLKLLTEDEARAVMMLLGATAASRRRRTYRIGCR